MTVRYCGPGGNNANNGLTWATRKADLNGVEDSPVAAGDLIWVAPGVYRETLTVDVSGSSGNVIEYRADVSGQNTDGVGGIVRITGSDNDQTVTRTNGIIANSKNYRTFTGFTIDCTSGSGIQTTDCTNWTIQDCTVKECNGTGIQVAGASQAAFTIRRLRIGSIGLNGVEFTHSATVSNTGHAIENYDSYGIINGNCVSVTRVGGITVKNSTLSGTRGVRVVTALAVGQTVTINNSIIVACSTGLQATTTGEIVEDYNTFFANSSARTNVNVGANSVTYPPLFDSPLLLSGFRFPWMFDNLSQWSQVAAKAGSGEASDDLFGTTRPATSSKKSWGAVQFVPALRDTGTVRTGTAGLRLSDAGRHQMFVPVTNVSTVFSVYVRWEADYAGTKPQLIVRQPGQSDTTVTATGSSGAWELLTTTLTPATSPGYVVIVFISNNTASPGSVATYFDDFTVA